MSNTPIVYDSRDASAPQLTGQNGSLVALLDALLRTGYGAKAGCGWTAATGNTGTLGAWRNSTSTGTGFWVQCKDAAEGTGGAKEAQMRGFESMTDAATGTNPFPSVAQLSTGVIWHKSSAASATTRPWWAMGCQRWLYLFIDSYGNGLETAGGFFVGDMVSLRPGDASHFHLSGSEVANQIGSSKRSSLGAAFAPSVVPDAANNSGWIARNYAQVTSGIRTAALQTSMAETTWGSAGVAYPFEVNSGLVFERGYLMEAARRPRARYPGVYIPLHPTGSFTDLQAFPSVPGMPSGTNFTAKLFRSNRGDASGLPCALFFDTTNAD